MKEESFERLAIAIGVIIETSIHMETLNMHCIAILNGSISDLTSAFFFLTISTVFQRFLFFPKYAAISIFVVVAIAHFNSFEIQRTTKYFAHRIAARTTAEQSTAFATLFYFNELNYF